MIENVFSGLASHDSNSNENTKTTDIDIFNQDSQASKHSSEEQTTMCISEENDTKMDCGDDSRASKSSKSLDSPIKNFDLSPDLVDKGSNSSKSSKKEKTKSEDKPKIEKKSDSHKHRSRHDSKSDHKSDKKNDKKDSKDRHRDSKESQDSKERKDSKSSSRSKDKDRRSTSSTSKHSSRRDHSSSKKESSSKDDKSKSSHRNSSKGQFHYEFDDFRRLFDSCRCYFAQTCFNLRLFSTKKQIIYVLLLKINIM